MCFQSVLTPRYHRCLTQSSLMTCFIVTRNSSGNERDDRIPLFFLHSFHKHIRTDCLHVDWVVVSLVLCRSCLRRGQFPFCHGLSTLECGEFAMEEGVCYSFQCADDDRSSCLPIPSQYVPDYFESEGCFPGVIRSIQSVASSEGGLHLPSSCSHFCLQELRNAYL